VPFFSMVNLVAGEQVVPELIQDEMTGERIAAESLRLIDDPLARQKMLDGLARVSAALSTGHDPIEHAAGRIVASISEGKH